MPEQKVVILMGSRSDADFATPIADLLKHLNVKHELRIASAHKTSRELLKSLEEYEKSEDEIVYITVAGLSDALSGAVAGFTKYPVIACPPDSKKYGWTKVFSSMITPRGIPVLFVAEPENAALAAAKILALSESSLQKSIARYQQKKREEVVEADKEIKAKGGFLIREVTARGGMMSYEVLETNLPLPLHKKGKVRDIYDLGGRLLIVSTDRISAFDVVLQDAIPNKGEALNRLSVFWFKKTEDVIPNHILDVVDPRTVLVKKANPIKIEFVVRGYLYGSAWRSYREGKKICGIRLPSGLRKAERLPEPVLTPTTKAEVGHDIEMTRTDVSEKIGKEVYEEIEEVSLRLYERACSRAEKSGIIIADTKLEFGFCNGNLILIDELFTSDSSRFWPSDRYEVGKSQISFDKQGVRDYLESTGWNKQPPAPNLPEHIIVETSRKYIEAYERLTARRF